MSHPKRTILLVEDNDTLRKLFADILTFGGYEVLTAGDGEEGWVRAKTDKPDFIMLDLEMPKLDGFGVLKLLRGDAQTKTIPVVVFSAVNQKEDVQKAIGLGANGYLNKGVHSPRYVLDIVKSFMPQAAAEADAAKPAEPTPKAQLFKLQVAEYQPAGEGQWSPKMSVEGYKCTNCGEELVVELYPGPEQDEGHWFYSRLICTRCSRVF